MDHKIVLISIVFLSHVKCMKAIKASLTIQRFNLDIPFSEKPIYVFACVHAFKCTALTIVACNILPNILPLYIKIIIYLPNIYFMYHVKGCLIPFCFRYLSLLRYKFHILINCMICIESSKLS